MLETTIEGASHVIINISGDVGLQEANDAAMYIEELTGENTNIIFGVMFPEAEDDSVKITVIATGLEDDDMHLTEEHTSRQHQRRISQPKRDSLQAHVRLHHPL